MRKTWDIFCCVVDNFGDIGVCWRLARQLVAEHDLKVRLWVDDLDVFHRLNSEVDPKLIEQEVQGVVVCHWPKIWSEKFSIITVAEVVIEAFGCQLPETYIDDMAKRSPQSLWLNLEYLSAESWVEGCHGLPSPQQKGPDKYFFFPGFSAKTGGLIRERNLIEQRLAFQQDPAHKEAFLQSIGVQVEADDYLVSLFSYENASLSCWLDELSTSRQTTHLLVPHGRIINNLQSWLKLSEAETLGKVHIRGAVKVQVIPFLSQQDYDHLLWSCDFNCVRGEDSFVRAQWAGKPFLWHIYPQQDNIHLEKLEAFLQIYNQNLSATANLALTCLWLDWNKSNEMQLSWQNVLKNLPELNKNAENWCFLQTKQINIAQALVEFYQNWLK